MGRAGKRSSKAQGKAPARKLAPRQAKFVAEYLVDLNATAAAIRAGYSQRSAAERGYELLQNSRVRAAIDEAMRRRQERVEVRADDVLRELLRLATVDVGQAFDEHGALRPLQEIPEDVRRAISGIETIEEEIAEERMGFVRRVRFWDKTKALELLGKHLKMFADKVEVSADGSFGEMLKAARERAAKRGRAG